MGQGWWLASDGKWYAPELHPDARQPIEPDVGHDALTQEIPTPSTGLSTGSPTAQGPTTQPPTPPPFNPVSPNPPTMINPVPPAPQPAPEGGRDKTVIKIAGAAVVIAFLAGIVVAYLVGSSNRSATDDTAMTSTSTELTTTTELSTSTTELSTESSTSTSSTSTEPSTTVTPPTTSVLPPPTTEVERKLMPDVVCMNLQKAQDTIQAAGVFYSRSFDATGAGRHQILDSNWIVVSQDPAPGTPIGEGDANLGVVKTDEPNPC